MREVTPVLWRRAALACAGGLALGIGSVIMFTPVQASDTLANLLYVADAPWTTVLGSELRSGPYFRPLFLGHQKLILELAAGAYTPVFRGYHAFQLALLLGAFVWALRVRTAVEFAAAALALTVVLGLHTFNGLVREAFPVNPGLMVIACCLAILIIARRDSPSVWTDIAACALFVIATATMEQGLLLWVCAAAACLAGWRGLSTRGVAAMTALCAAYLVLRIAVLGIAAAPGSLARDTGFGFGFLSPGQLQERFGSNPLAFYLYNVVCSWLTVLFSEPRRGMWIAVQQASAGALAPAVVLNVLSSTLTTAVIAYTVLSRRDAWRKWNLEETDRLLLVSAAVIAANGAISFAYTRDLIMSPAGVFYGVAAYAALAHVLQRSPRRAVARFATVTLMLFLSFAWTVRSFSVPHMLLHAGQLQRHEWADLEFWMQRQRIPRPTGRSAGMLRQLREDAMRDPRPGAIGDGTLLVSLVDHGFF
jgi:hypothetical protein